MLGSTPPNDISRARFDALTLEYTSLREELLGRQSSRYQILTLLSVSAGLVLGFAPDRSQLPFWAVGAVSFALFALGTGTWLYSGRSIGKLSALLAQVEMDINRVIAGRFDDDKVLSWKIDRQPAGARQRGWFQSLLYGKGETPAKR